MDQIRLGVSSCLLGNRVRYDGGDKLEPFLRDTLGKLVELVPVCPEVECGLPVPREPMHLRGDIAAPRLITVETGRDLTPRMQRWIARRLAELEVQQLDGFIFKSRSPSSGMAGVKIHDRSGEPTGETVAGLFAAALMRRFPLLPVDDEGCLRDSALRENFIERVFVTQRWRELRTENRRLGRLVEFHRRHKMIVLAHSPVQYRELGRLVAGGKELPVAELYRRYQSLLMQGLRLLATRAKHGNVLHHLLGYLKRKLTAAEKQELLHKIEAYRGGQLPLIVPLTLVSHYAQKFEESYLREQFYLNPDPLEILLRNHA
jgi:uncharacterized protein YbgA (DUF1722 family)/uncharacterized protein YbbK (DUF523 family)